LHLGVDGAAVGTEDALDALGGTAGDVGDVRASWRRQRVIDWLCLPRFDGASVFAGILDPARGGSSGITPVARPFRSLQRYDPDTNVLETLFTVEGRGSA
jgi:GH15 family glucan-1,4-alpha-glucosidase